MKGGNQESPLGGELRRSIREGPLSFKEYMAQALYHPQWGYYSSQKAPGREADFFTSVSVGPCFGGLLADYIHEVWEISGSPSLFTVLEQGGHVGVLAADILESIYAKFPALYKSIQLFAVERSSLAMTEPRLEAHAEHWSILPELAAISLGTVDLYFANELIDAFPVHRVVWRGPDLGWGEHYVVGDESLHFEEGPLSRAGLAECLAEIDVSEFEPGYVTEVNLEIAPWIAEVERALTANGRALLIDYGMASSTYYLPGRRDGTLQGYRNHERATNFLAHPGEQDLTAHVDFTLLEFLAESQGLQRTRFEEQSRFLTSLAKDSLLAMEKRLSGSAPDKEAMAWIRQFQQLTAMGPNFKVMELTKKG